MSARENLNVLGYPCWGPGCQVACVESWPEIQTGDFTPSSYICQTKCCGSESFGVCAQDPVDLSDLSESALRSMAGNGMSLCCAGWVLLMTILFVEDK